jgi:predicted metal-binding membrane protein
LKWVSLFAWPGAIHEGNGEALAIIDERATPQQREALLTILSGQEQEPGATYFNVFASTITKVNESRFCPIEFEADIDAGIGRFSVPGIVASVSEPIRNPVTGAAHRARVILRNGRIHQRRSKGDGCHPARLGWQACTPRTDRYRPDRSGAHRRALIRGRVIVPSLRFLSQDRAIVLASIAGITVLAWIYLAGMAQNMSDMAAMMDMPDMPDMPMPSPVEQFVLVATMWAVMMVGMMLPGAAPMILLYTAVQRQQGRRPVLTSGVFGAGYLLVWGGFAIAAAAVQVLLTHMALLSSSLTFVSPYFVGGAFLFAAAYELSPLKGRCLAHCRSPFAFIAQHWRSGLVGALRMGAVHGAFCLGCCCVMMLLLFAVGVMNLLWVAALSVLVLLQKVLPGGRAIPRATSLAMAAVGLALIFYQR